MARIFITGSTDGLGQLTAESLINRGHQVVLHARNEHRLRDAQKSIPDAEAIVKGDLSSIEETKSLAEAVNALGDFDAVIHNAGVYRASGKEIFAVNTLAPYILTCLIKNRNALYILVRECIKMVSPLWKR
jgi:short-subunit dehydrogenase